MKIAELRKSVRRQSAYTLLRQDTLRVQEDRLPIGTAVSGVMLSQFARQPAYLVQIKCPFLICHGDDDSACSFKGSEMVFALASTPTAAKFLHIYGGAQHNLLADLQRDPTMRDAWCNFFLT